MSPSRREIDDQIDAKIALYAAASREERREALKSAFKELMNEQMARLGGWTLTGIGTMVVAALVYVVFYVLAVKAGWTPPK